MMKKKKMTRSCEIARVLSGFFAQSIAGVYDTFRHMGVTRYWRMSDLQLVLKPWPSVLAEFGGSMYGDHVRFNPGHPYNRASTDALTNSQKRLQS